MKCENLSQENVEGINAKAHKILCYSPYSYWQPHGLWEITILHGLKLRGADIKYVLCDGLFSDCDLFRAAAIPRDSSSCLKCQTNVSNSATKMAMPFCWLGEYLSPDDFRKAHEWASSFEPYNIQDATYEKWEIGSWVRRSMNTFFRISSIDCSVPEILEAYRNFVYSGVIAGIGLSRVLDDYQPDVLFLFNGEMSTTRIAFELARERGVRVVCHERGLLKESIRLFVNETVAGLKSVKKVWQDWKEIPLLQKELSKVEKHMSDIQLGMNLNWTAFSPPPQDTESMCQQLSLENNSNRPLWVLFTSSDDECVSYGEWQGPFERQMDWIVRTIDYVAKYSEIDFVIRVHPNTAGKRAGGNNVIQLKEMENLRSVLPSNARMILPEDSISSYTLMKIATLGLVYHSFVGVEMACEGKPVVSAGTSHYSEFGFVHTVSASDEYEGILDKMRALPIRVRSENVAIPAYRFVNLHRFRTNIPFPLVKLIPDVHSGQIVYKTLDDLLPGREFNLDRICRIILDGESVCEPPEHKDHSSAEIAEVKWHRKRIQMINHPRQNNSAVKKETKYISFVVPARQVTEDELWLHRMQTFIDRLVYQCKKYKLSSEIIVVDWNCPRDREQLSNLITLPDILDQVSIRFIEVSPEVHSKFPNSDKLSFFQYISDNVGIRKAIGEYILVTAIDVLFADELFRFLARNKLDPDCFYRIDRYDLKIDRMPSGVSFEKQTEICSKHIIRVNRCKSTEEVGPQSNDNGNVGLDKNFVLNSDEEIDALLQKCKGLPPHTNACGDFMLMSRENWNILRGYPELPRGQLFLDGILVYMACASGIDQIVLPDCMKMYHLKHASSWQSHQDFDRKPLSLDYQKEYLPWCQKMIREKRPLNPNDENWGLAQYDLKEYTASESVMQIGKNGESDADIHNLDVFHEWITKLATAQKRLYYRDQTPESLNDLVNQVDKYKPTKIVELGTLSGLSLRTWLSADSEAEIIAIDLSFAPLRQSQEIIPVDLSRVKLLEQDILKTDFSRLWGPDDRVLLYIDAHDTPNVAIMDYVLQNAVPALPSGSMVVVDDLWHSPATLESKTARQFFGNTVINEIDPLQCFQGYYAPYWKGGSFFGFREVIPLLEWVNKNQIDLDFKPGIKSVAFEWKLQRPVDSSFDAREFEQLCGNIKYNPVENLHKEEAVYTQGDQQVLALCKQGAEFYAAGRMDPAMAYFQRASDLSTFMTGGFYAQGVILARSGRFEEALQVLEKETANPSPHPNAQAFLEDIHAWMKKGQRPKNAGDSPKRIKPITIFTMPKPFKGHIDIIQRNAIKSWTLLQPRPEIILLGDDEGTSEIAREFSLKHVPDVERNEFGTPLLNSLFAVAEANSSNSILAYVNADIIMMSDFTRGIETILNHGLDKFLMVGQRWDIHLRDLIDFSDDRWEDTLKAFVTNKGTLHAVTGVDYFVFRKRAWGSIPPFALGRTAWDNWLIKGALDLKMDVIDATRETTVVHQDHEYEHIKGGKLEAWNGDEAKTNLALAGGYDNIKSIAYARWILQDGRLTEKVPALNDRGEELYKLGDLVNAFAEFKNAIEIDPNDPRAYYNIGILCLDLGNTEEAGRFFEKAREVDSDYSNVVSNQQNFMAMATKANVPSYQIVNGTNVLDDCANDRATMYYTWEYIQKLPSIKLYAGDIVNDEKYNDLIGLSLTRSDHRHIKHDISGPLPLPDNSVDSYQAEDVFEHIEYDKLLPIINEIYRVLKPNAIFRLSVPDYGCDVLINRSVKDASGNIVFDPDGGGTPKDPGHVWFPRIDKIQQLLEEANFGQFGKIEYLHFYNMDGTFVADKIDYSKGHIQRTPDFDKRVQNPFRPMSMVIDLVKHDQKLQETILQENPKDEEIGSALRELEGENMINSSSPQKAYDKLWEVKLNDPEWLKNDGKGRVEFCANFLKANNMICNATKILDVGCGRGTLAHYLNPEVCLYGIDISEKAISKARKIYKQADVVDLNREKVPYEDKFFDLAITLDVIEHVFDPLFFLKEIHRLIKPGGAVILSTPNILNENSLKSFVHNRRFPKTSGDSFPYDGGHIHFFTYQDIFDLMKAVGFTFIPIGPLKDAFDYEFKEPMAWVSGKKI